MLFPGANMSKRLYLEAILAYPAKMSHSGEPCPADEQIVIVREAHNLWPLDEDFKRMITAFASNDGRSCPGMEITYRAKRAMQQLEASDEA